MAMVSSRSISKEREMTDRPTGAGSFTRWERGEVHWVGVALLPGCCNGAGCCRLPGKAL